MNESLSPDFEALLRRALAPVEPPADLAERLETTLLGITELAADELEAWGLGAMRDPRNWVRPGAAIVGGGAAATEGWGPGAIPAPRNWVRPVAAIVVGSTAATGLILLRARRRPATRRKA